MYGWYKVIAEKEDFIEISYSIGKNKSCDGILIYDKQKDDFITYKMSLSANPASTAWIIEHIKIKLKRKQLDKTKKIAVIG